MEALFIPVALIALAYLAVRYGTDSRPTLESREHFLAHTGFGRDSSVRLATSTPPDATAPAAPTVTEVVLRVLPLESSRYPTLDAIDIARGPGHEPFSASLNAQDLERHARELTDQHWSELAWLTGRIDRDRFDVVCAVLERERSRVSNVVVVHDAVIAEAS